MGRDSIRHLREKVLANGKTAHFWEPSKTVKDLGLVAEALGTDAGPARKRARELNEMADEMRTTGRASYVLAPGSVGRLFNEYQKSIEVMGDPRSKDLPGLKPRTRSDLAYYLKKIEAEFGRLSVSSISPRVIKSHYQRMVRDRGIAWGYHIGWAWRCVLTWAVSEDWIKSNPALEVTIVSPPKRKVQWKIEEAEAFIRRAELDGWHSIAVGADMMDCTAQSPVDIWKLKVRDYANGFIFDSGRAKTGADDAPAKLWPEPRTRLEAYLKSRGALLHPDAPLLADDRTGLEWIESTRHKRIQRIRKAAGLRPELQFQDFRRTAQNEARDAGATAVEIQHMARHKSAKTQERYFQPNPEHTQGAMAKRRAHRIAKRGLVTGTKEGQKLE